MAAASTRAVEPKCAPWSVSVECAAWGIGRNWLAEVWASSGACRRLVLPPWIGG